MKTIDFDYHLPEKLIAQFPLQDRAACKLMILDRRMCSVSHGQFKDLTSILKPGDRLVFNNTKVVPARILCEKETGAIIELLFTERISARSWKVIAKPAKKIPENTVLRLCGAVDILLTVAEVFADGSRVVSLFGENAPGTIDEILQLYGQMPLPHYIKRKAESSDAQTYQTVFAKQPGAIACPTAGLHFTEHLMQSLHYQKISSSFLTLHVGIGTFKPVKVDDPNDHAMHEETYELPQHVVDEIAETKNSGGRIIAVGTTVVRVLEHCSQNTGRLTASAGSTKLLILPGYTFKTVDGIITNFHVPKSTLLMLVSAFAGKEFILSAYREAISREYRFFSYGDAMILL